MREKKNTSRKTKSLSSKPAQVKDINTNTFVQNFHYLQLPREKD